MGTHRGPTPPGIGQSTTGPEGIAGPYRGDRGEHGTSERRSSERAEI